MFGLFHWRSKMKPANRADRDNRASNDGESIAGRLKNATPGRFEADKQTHERILQKIDDGYALEKQIAGTRSIRSFATPRRLAVAGGLTTAVAMAAFTLESVQFPTGGSPVQRTITAAFIAKKALAAIERPGMIIHYKTSGKVDNGFAPYGYNDDPQAPVWMREDPISISTETWIDRANKMRKDVSRYQYRSCKKMKTTELEKNGRTYTVMEYSDLARPLALEWNSPLKQFSDPLNSYAEEYRKSLENGKAEVLGEELVDGVATYKLKQTTIEPSQLNRASDTRISISNIRKDTYEPVRITTETWEADSNGGMKKTSSFRMVFEGFELIDPESFEKDVFSIDVPQNAERRIELCDYPMDEAKRFKEFNLYYLGKFFEGLKLTGMKYYKGGNVSPSRLIPDAGVSIDYYAPNAKNSAVQSQKNSTHAGNRNGIAKNDCIEMIIRPAFDKVAMKDSLVPQDSTWGDGKDILIDGKQAVLYESNIRIRLKATLFIQIGNATVEIHADDAEQAIRAAKSLRKIN